MNAFEKYVEKLVRGEALSDSDDGFPKNESSWEELFDFGVKRIGEIVTLRRKSAQHLTALRRGLTASIIVNIILLAVVLAIIGGRSRKPLAG